MGKNITNEAKKDNKKEDNKKENKKEFIKEINRDKYIPKLFLLNKYYSY